MITCWFCQRIVSIRFEANSGLPEWARKHIRHCPACRETCQSAKALIQQLSSTAKDQKRVTSPFLHRRIMSAIRPLENMQADTQRSRPRLGWAMATAMVCLAAASTLWLRVPFQPRQSAPKSAAASVGPALNMELPSVAQVDQWTKTLDAPLEQETRLVLSDATAAINTLARGFLPEDLLASSTEPAQH